MSKVKEVQVVSILDREKKDEKKSLVKKPSLKVNLKLKISKEYTLEDIVNMIDLTDKYIFYKNIIDYSCGDLSNNNNFTIYDKKEYKDLKEEFLSTLADHTNGDEKIIIKDNYIEFSNNYYEKEANENFFKIIGLTEEDKNDLYNSILQDNEDAKIEHDLKN